MSLYTSGAAPRVLVTRPAEDAPTLANALARAGYHPVVVPLLERRWRVEAVAQGVVDAPDVDWVFVTSATAADVLATAAPDAWRDAKWAAVGEATAHRLQQLGFHVDVVPRRATAADLVDALGDLTGQRVAYPRADLASPHTVQALKAAGAEVVDMVAYTNVPPEGHRARLHGVLPVTATTLMSGSAARRLAAAMEGYRTSDLGVIVCIGPSTERVALEVGLPVHGVAQPHSLSGLLASLEETLT